MSVEVAWHLIELLRAERNRKLAPQFEGGVFHTTPPLSAQRLTTKQSITIQWRL